MYLRIPNLTDMSLPTRHNNLLYFSFFWLFLGSFFVRSQLNVPPTIETNSGTGPEIIHCTTDPLIFTLQVSPTSSNSVLKYRYVRDRGNVISNLTDLTVSTTINQSLGALQDGDIVFAEIYLENNNGVFQKISETQNLIFGDQLNAVSGFFSMETLDPLSDLQGAISYFDFTASLLLHNNQYMVGMIFQHLNRPNKSFNNELSNPLPSLFTMKF